jgi:hypothetical protein
MVENEDVGFAADSKFMRVLLIIVTALLIFAGPTYVPYVLTSVNVSSAAATIAGFALFIVGLFLMLFLVRKKIVS